VEVSFLLTVSGFEIPHTSLKDTLSDA